MVKRELYELIGKKTVILDGATGSNLQKAGMPTGCCTEQWVLEHKEVLINLQKEYLMAGSDILYAPTFTCNRIKLAEYGLEDKLAEMNTALVNISKEAVRLYREETNETRPVYIAGDITMTGQQLAPMGTLAFEELVDIYKEQVKSLLDAGADLFIIETMLSLKECRAAVLAVKEICDLPVMVTLTFNEDGRTFYGTDAKTAVITMQSIGADVIGANCSTGPGQMADVLREMKQAAKVPLAAKPNAGLPKLINGVSVYSLDAKEFAEECRKILEVGIQCIGGCCGTTPEHISYLKTLTDEYPAAKVEKPVYHAVTTEYSTFLFSKEGSAFLIGERINPTGKTRLKEELRNGCFDYVRELVKEQDTAGAKILDINMGLNGIDEKECMKKAVEVASEACDLPLCIDSSHVDVIESVLREYPGRAIINSISLETEKIEKLLPIAKKYGAMFILLPLSGAGLPKNLNEKKQIITTILQRAYKIGLTSEDIIVDGLVTTAGANPLAAKETLACIEYCSKELNLCTVCGLSNISFGLPDREYVNSTFLSYAILAGLTMAIANPSQEQLVKTLHASNLLCVRNDAAEQFLGRKKEQEISEDVIYQAVVEGNRGSIISLAAEKVKTDSASEILDTSLIPGIQKVGELFEKGIYFLPQLIASAEAMKRAIDYLEPMLLSGGTRKKLGTIVIATVEGDIHDIGKNLVALLLKNYGFEVIDMGKDVPSEKIISCARENKADIIALSALMTTTMLKMKQVVKLRNEAKLSAKVIIGGAVITQSYCEEIGADGYSKDAQEAVLLVKRLLNL